MLLFDKSQHGPGHAVVVQAALAICTAGYRPDLRVTDQPPAVAIVRLVDSLYGQQDIVPVIMNLLFIALGFLGDLFAGAARAGRTRPPVPAPRLCSAPLPRPG